MNNEKIKTDIRQKQIKETAMQIIMNESLDALTIASIAEKIGITKSNIYRHFPSKDAILENILAEMNARLQEIVLEGSSMESARDSLHHIFTKHLEMLEEYKGTPLTILTDKIYRNNTVIFKLMTKTVTHYIKSIEKLLLKGIKNSEFIPEINVSSVALYHLGLIQAIIFQWQASNGKISIKTRGEEFFQIYITGISNSPTYQSYQKIG